MPRDYDQMREKEDREFIMRGETFTVRRASPRVLGEIEEIEKGLDKATTYGDIIEIIEARLMLLIDDSNGSVDRWRKIRDDEADPVTYGEIMDVSRWAVEQVSGLPTMQPAPSEAGRGKTVVSLKGGSR